MHAFLPHASRLSGSIKQFKLVSKSLALGAMLTASTLSMHAQQSKLSCKMTSISLVNGQTPQFTVTQSTTSSGTSTWTFPARTIDSDTTNFATGTIGLTGALTIRVTDATNTYSSGNFAGFALASSLINYSALSSLEIRTILNGIQQESVTGSNLVAAPAGVSGAYDIGFFTNFPFNAIEIRITSTQGIGSYFVYKAILKGTGSCTPPVLACNTNNRPSFGKYASILNNTNTGVTGISPSALANTSAVADADTVNYATLTTTTAVQGSARISVKDLTATYPSGTFAGYDIENATLLTPGRLNMLSITTYRDGIVKQTKTGVQLLMGASVQSSSARQVVGFVADSSFDEIQVTISQTNAISVGTTKIYSSVVKKLCSVSPLQPNKRTRIKDEGSPIAVSVANSGFNNTCNNCTLSGPGNILDTDTTNSATITFQANTAVTGQISVRDAVNDYPRRTYAGFDLQNSLISDANLLNYISFEFYRDDVLRQTVPGSKLLMQQTSSIPTGRVFSSRMTVGYYADSSFDQVKLNVSQPQNESVGNTEVYGFMMEEANSTLPLRLVSFAARSLDGGIQLNWLTADEEYIDRFEIERSFDGRKFSIAATKPSVRKTNRGNYSWTDVPTDARSGKIYYRLKIMGTAGEATYSAIVIVDLGQDVNIINSISPNPVTGPVNINLNMPKAGDVTIHIADLNGRKVMSQKSQAAQGFSTLQVAGSSSLQKGMYMLTVEYGGKLNTQKFMKQ